MKSTIRTTRATRTGRETMLEQRGAMGEQGGVSFDAVRLFKGYMALHGTMPQVTGRKVSELYIIRDTRRFEVLKKCTNKFDRLVYHMLLKGALKPNLKVESVIL